MPILTVFDSQGPASSVRPAAALQPGPLSQLITTTHDSNPAAAAAPLPAAVAPALAKLSVQTLPTLQTPSLQAPDLSSQLQPLSHPSMVSTMPAVGPLPAACLRHHFFQSPALPHRPLRYCLYKFLSALCVCQMYAYWCVWSLLLCCGKLALSCCCHSSVYLLLAGGDCHVDNTQLAGDITTMLDGLCIL